MAFMAFSTFCTKFNEVTELTNKGDSLATFNGLFSFFKKVDKS
jgi:hypothetical protein